MLGPRDGVGRFYSQWKATWRFQPKSSDRILLLKQPFGHWQRIIELGKSINEVLSTEDETSDLTGSF